MESDLARLSSQSVSIKEKSLILEKNFNLTISGVFGMSVCLVYWPANNSIISGFQDGSLKVFSLQESFPF